VFRPRGGDQLAVITGEESSRHDVSCFADDVIVDFPSVAPAVERIRRAFLADERPHPLRAEIQISRREAMLGATLPLEVPVRCTCTQCGGRGESWTVSCSRCGGRGSELLHHALQVTVPSGVLDGACFHFTVTARHNPPTRIELFVELTD
jgi:DnaJ-class molecular chaperone